jgi:curved DNA-binding protein CbpA
MPSDRDQDVKARRERAQQLLAQDHFQALGVARTATPEEVQKAFFEAVKTWHPDRLPPGLEELRPLFTQVFGKLDAARATLTDPTRRGRYTDELARPPRRVLPADAAAAEASVELKKAEAFLKKNDTATAERHLRRAVQLVPALADAHALLAWIRAKPTSTPDDLKSLVAELDAVITREDSSARARFFRGQLRKRLGLEKEANADFVRACELDPSHIDAQREVRLFRMRAEKSAPPSKADESKDDGIAGFFRKLFKR